MARVQPRKLPDWLGIEAGTPVAPPMAEPQPNTARVLEFPSTAESARRARSASSEPGAGPSVGPASVLHRPAGSLDGLRTSNLSPEPAYKSVLGRLSRLGLGDGTSRPRHDIPQPTEQERGAAAPQLARPPSASAQEAARPASDAARGGPQPAQLHVQAGNEQGEQSEPELRPKRQSGPGPGEPPLPQRRATAGGLLPDPALQQQLKERIERAKAEIKQQLSPLFRVSQLLLAGQGPEEAACALEEAAAAGDTDGRSLLIGAAGAGGAGLGLLGSLPGSPAAATRVQGQLGADDDAWRIRSGLAEERADVRENPLFEQPGSPLAEEADSLVLSARAAVIKAHATIADLTSPPRHSPEPSPGAGAGMGPPAPQSTESAAVGLMPQVGGSVAPAAARESSPQPLYEVPASSSSQLLRIGPSEQQQQQQQLGALVLDASPQQPPPPCHPLVPFDPPAADLEGRIAQLRQRSESAIRLECDRLVAAMHGMFDDFLLSVQQRGLLVRVAIDGAAAAQHSGAGTGGPASPSKMAPRADAPASMAPRPSSRGEAPEANAAGAVLEEAAGSRDAAEACCTVPAGDAQREVEFNGPTSRISHGLGNLPPNAMHSSSDAAASAAVVAAAAPPQGTFEFSLRRPGLQGQSAAGNGCSSASEGSLGFGSPIRLGPGSQRPSPVKPSGVLGAQWRQLEHASAAAASQRTPSQQLFSAAAELTPPATAASVAAGGGRESRVRGGPSAFVSSPLSSATFLTAGSGLGLGGSRPRGLQQATSRPPVASRVDPGDLPAPAVASRARQLLGDPVGGRVSSAASSQRRDLDSIVSSIRRLAAETRLKQAALAPPSSKLLQPAPSLLRPAAAQGSKPLPLAHRKLASLQGPPASSPTMYTAGSRLTSAQSDVSSSAARVTRQAFVQP